MSFFHQLPYIIAAGMQRKVVVDGWQVSHLGILKASLNFNSKLKLCYDSNIGLYLCVS